METWSFTRLLMWVSISITCHSSNTTTPNPPPPMNDKTIGVYLSSPTNLEESSGYLILFLVQRKNQITCQNYHYYMPPSIHYMPSIWCFCKNAWRGKGNPNFQIDTITEKFLHPKDHAWLVPTLQIANPNSRWYQNRKIALPVRPFPVDINIANCKP